jgi:uncharacterized membrane protein YhaH (DUF805 family)
MNCDYGILTASMKAVPPMENTTSSKALAEMRIPKSWSEALFLAAIHVIVVISSLAAVFNLLSLRAMPLSDLAPSIIWLLLVFLLVGNACRKHGGVRRFTINWIGQFALQHMAEITWPDQGPAVLCCGYDLFQRRFYYFRVRCDGIRSVDWSTGQATSLAGRDMNDWQVALWFDREFVILHLDHYDCNVFIVGLARRRQETETFGHLFIDFLRKAAIPVAQLDAAMLQSLLGKCGLVSSPLRPVGTVKLDAGEYPAHACKGYIESGVSVEILEVRGLSLLVQTLGTESNVRESGSGTPAVK